MRIVNDEYRSAVRAPARYVYGRLTVGNTLFTDDQALLHMAIAGGGSVEKPFGSAISAKLTAGLRTLSLIPAGTVCLPEVGVLVGGEVVWLPMGRFTVAEAPSDPEAKTTTLTAYDAVDGLSAHTVSELELSYPCTLKAYAQALAAAAGLSLADGDWLNSDLVLTTPPNLSGSETLREAFAKIAECALGNGIADRDGKLSIRRTVYGAAPAAVENITADVYFELSTGAAYGPVNTLTMARLPQNDNIYRDDAAAVQANGRIALQISDNPFLDGMRDTVIDSLFAEVHGAVLQPYTVDWRGDPRLEHGDPVTFTDAEGNSYAGVYTGETLEFDGGLSATAEFPTVTAESINYSAAGGIAEKVRRAEMLVDKVNGQITAVVQEVQETEARLTVDYQSLVSQTARELRTEVSETYETKDGSEQKYTTLSQTVEGLAATASHRGGENLLLGTAAYELEGWETSENAGCTRSSSLLLGNVQSGGAFVLPAGESLAQTVATRRGERYCWLARVYIDGAVSPSAVLTVAGEDIAITGGGGWLTLQGSFTAPGERCTVQAVNHAGTLYLADLTLMPGERVTDWQQAANEIYTDDMMFAGGVLSVGGSHDEQHAEMSGSHFSITSNSTGRHLAYFAGDTALFGRTVIRGSLTVQAEETESCAMAFLPQGDGHGFIVIND